ncbi:galactose-specific lectin nattectin-like [Halichoeres trimaculatus]|uniref:galactose-specific lectin nattectin-like n=1 Tax=Halichoeres trimaculatus TaxID=147232 RepID=UPI003D9E3C2C
MEMCLKLIALLCVSTGLWIGADASCKACPAGWTQFESHCYLFQHSAMAWADAEKHCTTLGANLVSLHSKEQHAFLQNTLRNMAGKLVNIWVGGYDAVKEGVWLWSDGNHFDFKSWSPGEPNDYNRQEDCMEMNFLGRDNINDNTCSKSRSFFCAKVL